MVLPIASGPLEATRRDSVDAFPKKPPIVSISDIHGYLESARSALLTLADHPDYDPVVVPDSAGRLHWAEENYVLVFNGDLIDRGPANEAVLELVARLIDEAPPGRVRVTLGNHEAMALSPDHFAIPQWFAGQVTVDDRRRLLAAICSGHVVAAYRGHNVTYAHAGSPTPYRVPSVNASLRAAAEELAEAAGTATDRRCQTEIIDSYQEVLGVGGDHLKAPGAGLVWLHFDFLPPDAPPQVVGHTRHRTPTQKGAVSCQNVLRENLECTGGEAVFFETPETLSACIRSPDGGVDTEELATFEG